MCVCVCQLISDLGLLEEDRGVWVDATGQQAGGHVQDVKPKQRGVLGLGDGVQVHDAVQHGRVLALQGHPALQGPQEVPQVGHPSGLDPREHSGLWTRLEAREGRKKVMSEEGEEEEGETVENVFK